MINPINKTWTKKKQTYSTALLKLICGIKLVIQTTEPVACVAGVERGRGWGIGRKGKRGGGLERGGGDACSKNPLLFISADAGVRKFLIG